LNFHNLTHELTREFILSPRTRVICETYFIRHWSSNYVWNELNKCPRIVRAGIAYAPIFLHGTSLNDLACAGESLVKLSFRKLYGFSSGYVLISPKLSALPTCIELTERNIGIKGTKS